MRVRHAIWPVGAVVVALTFAMVGNNRFTTYGGLGPWWRWSEAAAAVVLIGAGTIVTRSHRGLGLATAATGALWLAPEWAGWTAGPNWVRAVALAAGGAVLTMAVFAGAAHPGLSRSSRRTTRGAALVGLVVIAVARVLLIDPFGEPRCWRTCRPNPLAVDGLAAWGRLAERVGVALLVLAALAVIVAIGWRSWRGVATVGVLAGLGVPLIARIFVTEDPNARAFVWSFVIAVGSAGLVAAGQLIDVWREWRLSAALFQLVSDVRAAPAGTLETAMAHTIGDPSLRLLYWSAAQDTYVDANGRTTAVPVGAGTTVTSIVRRGQPIAALAHRATIDGTRIARAIGPAARLSLENEQLRAATLAELAELKASRSRIVERADAERARLERNLHDGAQQRIVGIALLLRTIRTRLTSNRATTPHDALLARAEQHVATALDDLRRLAVGIHPAVLTDGGLRAAVADLAEGSTDLAIYIEALPTGRQPRRVEATAYLVIADAVADARRRSATTVSVSARDDAGRLIVELVDDAPLGDDAHAAIELGDRVGALDGHLIVAPSVNNATRVYLELPCAS